MPAEVHLWLDRTLRPLFANRVLAITEDVIVRWKAMVVDGQKRGHTFGQPDLFIAAIAALEILLLALNNLGLQVTHPLALQLHFVLSSESMGHHDSGDHGWSEHRLRRRLSFGRRRCGM